MPSRMSLSEQSESKTPSWFVYIAKAHTVRYYVGISTDVELRIRKHNSGAGSRFAKNQGPFILVYVSAPFIYKSEARQRELQLKGWSRDKKEKLISGEWE
jgi:predicted GIY-YIG superfamily endonuclease